MIFLIIICVSGFTLFINLLLIVVTCTVSKTSLPSVFGTALMFFNILLSLYGVALAVYLFRGYATWDQRFCQGFTSIKLFALGASVWTMMMLTFHRSVRAGIETEREAIFKGIVYILEGLMLSGVFAVMSWIKLDKFDYLCVVFEPITIVEWLLTGIEIFYYFMLFCLMLRYPYHQIRKKKRSGEKRLDTSHPIFAMVLLCFFSWGAVYIATLPVYGLASDRVRRMIRVVGIIAPLSLQAFIFAVRNTWCCLCRDPPCAKKKENEVLVCQCTGTETCTACEDEYEALRYGAQLNYGNGKVKEKEITKPAKEKKEKKKKAKKEKKEKKKKNKQKLTTTSITIEKSPILKHKETSFNENDEEVEGDDDVAETPLLQDTKHKEQNNKTLGKPSDDSTPLLDDTDGSQAPKAVHDGTPVRTGTTTEHPSFVHMDSAVDVDSLPKEKPPKTIEQLQANKNNQEPDERKSRGPTFFPLTEKHDTGNTGEPVTKRAAKSPKKRKKKKKKSANHENRNVTKSESNEKQINGDEKRTSTASLEWDHYSDSSGSISRSSDCFPDDLVVDEEVKGGEEETLLKKTQNHEQNNGISRNESANKTISENKVIEPEKSSCDIEKQVQQKDPEESKISKKKKKSKAKFIAGGVNGELTAN